MRHPNLVDWNREYWAPMVGMTDTERATLLAERLRNAEDALYSRGVCLRCLGFECRCPEPPPMMEFEVNVGMKVRAASPRDAEAAMDLWLEKAVETSLLNPQDQGVTQYTLAPNPPPKGYRKKPGVGLDGGCGKSCCPHCYEPR